MEAKKGNKTNATCHPIVTPLQHLLSALPVPIPFLRKNIAQLQNASPFSCVHVFARVLHSTLPFFPVLCRRVVNPRVKNASFPLSPLLFPFKLRCIINATLSARTKFTDSLSHRTKFHRSVLDVKAM